MKIYIASSWKNHVGVELLTKSLREQGHSVLSWIENNYGEGHNHVTGKFDFETWCNTDASNQSFEFDTNGALNCPLFIYYGPAGKDCAAECGMSFAKGNILIGLYSKGEDWGLMRKMFSQWFSRVHELLLFTSTLSKG